MITGILMFFRLNPIAGKVLFAAFLAISIMISFNKCADHYIDRGIAQERSRRDKIDADNKAKTEAALEQANSKVKNAEKALADVSLKIAQREMELQHVKTDNEILQSDLISKRKRLSVLLASGDSAGNGKDTSAGYVGKGSKVAAELDPAVAANLVELAGVGDQAIIRLNACIEKYEKAESIVNSLSK